MGRHKKIPGKKHRGIKDPEAQRAKREAILKPKLNSLPKDLDSQEVPKKLLDLMKFKESSNTNQSNRKSSNHQKGPKLLDSSKHMGYEMRLPGMKKPLRPVPVFKQNPGEPEKSFLFRMESQVKQFLKRRNYETKNNVDLVEDPVTGRPKFVEAEKDELDEERDQKKRDQLAKRGIVVRSKEEKRQLRRQKEKERKKKKKRPRDNKNDDEFKDLETSKPSFNDVAHQPPTLCLPRGVSATEKRRPGAGSHLLLKDKLGIKSNSNSRIEKKKNKPEMSLAAKERLRVERERVIEQYRKLKSSKGINKF